MPPSLWSLIGRSFAYQALWYYPAATLRGEPCRVGVGSLYFSFPRGWGWAEGRGRKNVRGNSPKQNIEKYDDSTPDPHPQALPYRPSSLSVLPPLTPKLKWSPRDTGLGHGRVAEVEDPKVEVVAPPGRGRGTRCRGRGLPGRGRGPQVAVEVQLAGFIHPPRPGPGASSNRLGAWAGRPGSRLRTQGERGGTWTVGGKTRGRWFPSLSVARAGSWPTRLVHSRRYPRVCHTSAPQAPPSCGGGTPGSAAKNGNQVRIIQRGHSSNILQWRPDPQRGPGPVLE